MTCFYIGYLAWCNFCWFICIPPFFLHQPNPNLFNCTNNMWVLALSPLPCDWLLPDNGLYWPLIVNARQQVLYRRFWLNQGAAEQTLCGLFGRVIKSFWPHCEDVTPDLRNRTEQTEGRDSADQEFIWGKRKFAYSSEKVTHLLYGISNLVQSDCSVWVFPHQTADCCKLLLWKLPDSVLHRAWKALRMSNQATTQSDTLLQQTQSERRAKTQTCVKCFPWGGNKSKHSFEGIAKLRHAVLLSDLISIIWRVWKPRILEFYRLEAKKKKERNLKLHF